MNKRKMKIGITGGIGSGKSAFAGYIELKGYPVLKADDISKEILASDAGVKRKVIKIFGDKAFRGDVPDKKFLAEQAFGFPEKVLQLNAVLHPSVLRRIEREMHELLKLNNLVFVEAALVYEADMENLFDYVVLITASEELKMKRKTADGGMNPEDFKQRSMNQIPDEEKKKRADFIFENSGSLKELQQKVELLLTILGS